MFSLATMSVEGRSSLQFILEIYILRLQRAAEDIRCSESALGIVGIWVRFAWDRQRFYCLIVLDPSEMNDAM